MISNKDLGKRLKHFRRNKNITQAEMAEYCHVSQNHISTLERGIYTCSASTLITYAEKLNISLDELVGLRTEPGNLHIPQQTAADGCKEQQQSCDIQEEPERHYRIVPELQDLLGAMNKAQQEQILDIIRILKRPVDTEE